MKLNKAQGTALRNAVFVGATAVLLVILFAFEFQAYFWTRDYAYKQALRRVTKACLNNGRNPKLLVLEKEQTVSNAIWSFDWIYQGETRHFYGAWISRSGCIEIYTGDPNDPESAAYAPH